MRVINRQDVPRKSPGFTLVELLVVVAIIGILVALLLPAVQQARASARRMACSNNLRQVALANCTYESAVKRMPVNQIGPGASTNGAFGPGYFSWLVDLLPYIEENAIYDRLDQMHNNGDGDGFTISDSHPNAEAVSRVVSTFLCPSDSPVVDNRTILGSANPAPGSYAGNAGWPSRATGFSDERRTPGGFNGVISLIHPSSPVPWHLKKAVRMRDIRDGTSKTALIAERLIQTGSSADEINRGDDRLKSRHILERAESLSQIVRQMDGSHAHVRESAYVGRAWASGYPLAGPTYMHVATPNSRMGHYATSADEGDMVITAGSRHSGGANLAMVDCSVHFISDSIEPEVWWAAGGRNDGHPASLSN